MTEKTNSEKPKPEFLFNSCDFISISGIELQKKEVVYNGYLYVVDYYSDYDSYFIESVKKLSVVDISDYEFPIKKYGFKRILKKLRNEGFMEINKGYGVVYFIGVDKDNKPIILEYNPPETYYNGIGYRTKKGELRKNE